MPCGGPAIRLEKFVPVAFAPRLKEPLCVRMHASIHGWKLKWGWTYVETGVGGAVGVDERGLLLEDDARLWDGSILHICVFQGKKRTWYALFSLIPTMRFWIFHPGPLTAGRGLRISMD